MSDSGSKSNKQGFWRHPAVQLIVPIVLPWLLTKIEDMKLEWAWNWIPEWVVSVGRWFNTPIGITPAWIISAIAAAFLLVRLIKLFASRSSQDGPDIRFLNYVTERIDGLQWKWRWHPTRTGQFGMEDILALCPRCSYPMVWTYDGFSFGRDHGLHCEECKHSQALDTSRSDTENRIRRRVAHTLEQRANLASEKS